MAFFTDIPVTSVVIAGTGGFSLEVFDYLTAAAAAGGAPVAGFIDALEDAAVPGGIDRPLLGSIDHFRAADAGQVVVVALGNVAWRKDAFARLWGNGVRTPAFVAPSAMVSPAAEIGTGVVICPYTIVNRNARLGDGVLVNVHGSVGHGASVGAHSVLSPYAALNGDAVIGESCFLGTRATIYPRIRIGDNCVVDSHTGVRVSAEDRKLISSRGDYQVTNRRG